MKLYGYWRSSSAWRVRIVLELKGIACESVPVNLAPTHREHRQDSYRAKNPLAQVPCLELEDGARLTQSVAIIHYLERLYPTPALFTFDDPWFAAQVWQAVEIVNSGIQPLQNAGVLQRVDDLGGDAGSWARTFMGDGLAALEALAATHGGPYLLGPQLTLADVYLVPQLYNARRYALDLAPFPRLCAAESQCSARPEFVRSHPDQQKDRP